MSYDPDNVLTAIATVLVGLPALVPTLLKPEDVTPQITLVVGLLALIGGAILKQSKPIGGGGGLSDEDVRRIAAEQEAQRRQRVKLVPASRKRPAARG